MSIPVTQWPVIVIYITYEWPEVLCLNSADFLLHLLFVDGQFMKWENTFDNTTKSLSYTGDVDVLFKAERSLMSFVLNKYINNDDDGKAGRIYAAIGENRALIRIFSLSGRKNGESPQTLSTMQVEDGYVGNLSFHSTDPDLLIATGKKVVLFYEFKSGEVLRRIEMPSEIKGFDISIDGTKWVVGLANGEVRMYSLD
jgi:WD40 repeat protein